MGSNNPITLSQVLEDLKSNQVKNKNNKIELWISRNIETHIKTNIQERWATFNQMRMIQNKAIDTDAIYISNV